MAFLISGQTYKDRNTVEVTTIYGVPAIAFGLGRAPTVSGGTGTWPPTQPARGFEQYPGYSGNIAGSGLTDMGGATISGANQTVIGKKNFALGHTTGTLTIRGCLFTASGTNAAALVPQHAGDMIIDYCTIRPDSKTDSTATVNGVDGYQYGVVCDGTSASPGTWNGYVDGSLTVTNTHVWGFANASKESSAGSTVATRHKWLNCVIENPRLNNNPSYDDHTDGLGSPGGGNLPYYWVEGCWIIGPSADTNGIALQNTPSGNYPNVTITGNVFGGFGNTIQISQGNYPTIGSPANLTFTNNVFHCAYKPQLSPLYNSAVATGSGTVWRGNKVYVPASGATWGAPSQDGLFWLPVDNNISGSGSAALAPFVSTTDYM